CPPGLYQRRSEHHRSVGAVSERAGAGFEPTPHLEERPLPGLEVEIFVSGSGQFKRTERAVYCRPAVAPPAMSGRQGLRNPDTSRAVRPSTRTAGEIPHLENKWFRILRLLTPRPATISPRCSTSPLPAAICRKARSSRARSLQLRRTWPSS